MLKFLQLIFSALVVFVFLDIAIADKDKHGYNKRQKILQGLLIHTPPIPNRIDGSNHPLGKLREENISDIEVREIETEAREIHPGAIVNIGGVTVGCPCEDGQNCTNQVWIVAFKPQKSMGLMFSKIERHWKIGPVQKWWLDYESIFRSLKPIKRWRMLSNINWYEENQLKLENLNRTKPVCNG